VNPAEARQKFVASKVCVLVPTYNNAGSLKKVLDSVLEYTDQVIVVNDGSTDDTSAILEGYKAIRLVSYPKNVGKGWALRKGFEAALLAGFDYAITIDSDGQHFASDLPLFLAKLEATGPCLIMGARNLEQSGIPQKSSFGNKFSNFWFWAETAKKLPDTQTGYRLYPLQLMKNKKWFTRKFEFEIEVIVRMAWKYVQIESIPISVYYASKETRISHFRPFKDFMRIGMLNATLVAIAFAYIYPRDFMRGMIKKESYVKLKNQIFFSNESRMVISSSIAFGIFMGIIPFWGFQLVIAIFLAMVFRLNQYLVIIFANISIPPMIPLIIFLSYKMGAFWKGRDDVGLLFSRNITLEAVKLNIIQYLYGSVTLAILASLLFGVTAYLLLTIFKAKRKRASDNG
jgi:glycosyltransferase involved in cell wall biosynthesis